MRILYATQWFEPEPILKGIYFAKLLRDRGHDVRVVTGFPNYPGGRIYPGYRLRWLHRDVMDDVPVDRIPLYPSHSRSSLGRVINYLSFAVALTIYGLFTRRRPDVLYAYHPPLTVGLAAAFITRIRRIPFVYDVQDLWPDTVAASGMMSSRFALRLLAALSRRVYASADRIIVQSPGFKRILVERGIPADRIEVIYNWANELEARTRSDGDLSAFAFAGRFNVVYAGSLGPTQGLDAVLRAAKLVGQSEPTIQIVLVGGGIEVDRLRALAAELGTSSVRIMPRMPQSEIGSVLAAADVLLVHLKDDPLFEITIPSKTQFCLAMGKPILMGMRGDAAALIERAGAGVVVEPENVEAIAAAVLDLARRPREDLAVMGARGREYYARELSGAVGVGRTLTVLDAVVANRAGDSLLKRVFDVVVAAAALVVLSPVIVLTAALVRLDLGSPVMFQQIRAGRNGEPFRLYKFRTMRDARDADGQPLPDGERLTRLSRVIRRLSLDELPQLWNVLRGDMSLVGPRPLLMAYLDRYTPAQARRHDVRPGITGWAQVNGRNAISWDEKLAFDTWYVKNRSFGLDLKILAMTLVQVIRGGGVSAAGHATMFEFRGTLDSPTEGDKPKNS